MELDFERRKKRQKILAVFGGIFSVFLIFFLWAIIPSPSCGDGKQNGGEMGVDCGGMCPPCQEKAVVSEILVKKTAFVKSGSEKYDLVVWLANPNDIYGARLIVGSFFLFGLDGQSLGEVEKKTFLLPREGSFQDDEGKFVLAQGISIDSGSPLGSIEWKTKEVDWVVMTQVANVGLSFSDRNYKELSQGTGFSKVSGLLTNNSYYDWNDVVVSILLRDSSGTLLATHGTSRQTFRSGEKWDFQLIFPDRFSGEVRDVVMQAETNIFNNENFLKSQLPGGEFQKP